MRPARLLARASWPLGKAPQAQVYPTPTASRYGSGQNGSPRDGREAFAGKGSPSLDTIARQQGGHLSARWVEVVMGFPAGWTEV